MLNIFAPCQVVFAQFKALCFFNGKVGSGLYHPSKIFFTYTGTFCIWCRVAEINGVGNAIADGNYDVYFASGVSWDGKRNTFSRNCGFSAFEQKMKFTSGGGQYTRYTITLNPVAGGNAPSKDINPDDFPRG